MGELHRAQDKRASLSISTRTCQAIAYLLTRGNRIFQKRYLGAGMSTVRRWARQFRNPFRRPGKRIGRPNVDPLIVEWVLQLKRENPRFGKTKIADKLRSMGIRIADSTVGQILKDHGFSPFDDNR